MFSRYVDLTAIAVCSALTAGCDSSGSPSSPSNVSLALVVSYLVPNSGNPAGTTLVTISGGGFQTGATATFDGIPGTEIIVNNGRTLTVRIPAHAEGVVDVAVTNTDGRIGRLPGGFTYGAGGGPSPSVIGLSPNVGSTGGGDFPDINGKGFRGSGNQPSFTVTFDGISVPVVFANDTHVYLAEGTPAHAAGPVDVVVTNTVGQTATAHGGYTYVPPESLDFNGNWRGTEGMPPFRFSIQGNALTSVSCGSSLTVAISPPVPLSHGEFSYATNDGAVISGRIVSASLARGAIALGSCMTASWFAERE